MSGIALVQATFPDQATAEHAIEAVIEERLAACATLIPGCRSVFRWQGAVNHADEAIVQFKTTPARLSPLTERLRALHPYDQPVVESWTAQSDPAVLAWIAAETA